MRVLGFVCCNAVFLVGPPTASVAWGLVGAEEVSKASGANEVFEVGVSIFVPWLSRIICAWKASKNWSATCSKKHLLEPQVEILVIALTYSN